MDTETMAGELHMVPAQATVNIECKVTEIRPLGSHDMFIAEVVGVSIDDTFLDEKGKFHLNDSGLVTYSHGEYYTLGEKLGSFGYSVRKKKKNEEQQHHTHRNAGRR